MLYDVGAHRCSVKPSNHMHGAGSILIGLLKDVNDNTEAVARV